jgi:hypothetical protein
VHARTQYQRYLDTARKASAYFISHLPASGVPPWDFNAPNAGNMADSSAATIAANGFLSLSQIETNLGNSTGAAYYQNAAIKVGGVIERPTCPSLTIPITVALRRHKSLLEAELAKSSLERNR